MEHVIGLERVRHDPASVITVGTFDALHLGHQALLAEVSAVADRLGGRSTVISFYPHPREVIRGDRVPLVLTVEERAEQLAALGIARSIVVPFTPEVAALSAEAFVRDVLVARVGARAVVVGYDHGFGRGREGDRQLLEQMGRTLGFEAHEVPPAALSSEVVTTSRIRRLLAEAGAVREVAELLGRRLPLSGTVVEGDRRGRTLGFPTANLRVKDPRKLVPARGVYGVRVRLPGGEEAGGMMNIGVRPTFGGGAEDRLEVHVLDFEGDWYGQQLRVEFVERLRGERRFSDVQALQEQLSRDRQRCTELFARLD